jgi:hypothetical protein
MSRNVSIPIALCDVFGIRKVKQLIEFIQEINDGERKIR